MTRQSPRSQIDILLCSRINCIYLSFKSSTKPMRFNMFNNRSFLINLQSMSKSFNFSKLYTFILISCLIIIASGIKKEKKDHPKTIVEANHYYSVSEKRANYDIKDITSGKSLVLLLKKDERKSKYITDFEISLTSGTQTTNCNFKKVTDLCIIPNTTTTDLNMIIECSSLPCEVSWIIYQPQAKDPDSNQIALNLFTLHDSNDHLIGEITCNDPAVATLDQDVTIYSQTPYRRVYKNSILYVLFNNEKKGYVFIDIDQKSRACSKISFKQPPQILSASENSTTDFIVKESSVMYELSQVPKSDFRLQCATVRLDTIKQLKSSMTVTLIGLKGNNTKKIVKHNLAVSNRRANDFTIAFKKVQQYEKLTVIFEVSSNQVIKLETRLAIGDTHIIQLGQNIFLKLKKSESMSFKIEGDGDSEQNEMNFMVPKRKNQLTLSKASCPLKQDCNFSVTATEDTENMIYISSKEMNSTFIDEDGQGLYEFEQIQFLPIGKKSQRKIRIGDNIFFKKTLKKDQSIQVHVNSPNVILYAASQAKCQVPDQRCRQRTGNFHHPFIYKAKVDCELLINVEGLENTQFQLSIIDQQKFILLEDGTPFSYTMDSHEDRIDFQVKLKQKSDVSFNLVAPLNTLKLLVSNEKQELPDSDSAEQSTDGYIFIEKSDIKELNFVISVMKIKQTAEFFTHFTIIVSSKNSKVRLDPSVTSYQTLLPANYRDYVFEFDPSESYILNFYAYNLKEQKVDIQVRVSDEQKKWEAATPMTITKQSDFLDLREVSINLCEQEGVVSCQIFLRITNKMDKQIDISVTLLMKNAIVELKDGIWQAFPQNLLTSTTNFYFYPRHQDKDLFISYHSMIQELRIAYHLWKYDANSINPAEWPFPKVVDSQEQLQAGYKPNNYIMIDHQQMKDKCWPSCLLLISFYIDFNSFSNNNYLKTLQNANQYMNFKIMASNSHIQLPQKQRLSLTVAKKQQKLLLIDLKYLLDKQKITFFANSAIGSCYFNANLYSQQKTDCPTADENADYSFLWGETQLLMSDINKKLKQKGMSDDKNKYLCMSVRSEESCKMSIQYISNSGGGYKKIGFDTTEQISLGKEETKYYQTDGFFEQYAKITRLTGFPFIKIKKCPNRDEFMQCMEDFKNDEDKGKQIVTKTESFTEDPCPMCIFLFKFSTMEPSKIDFHLQSKYSELELKEKVILSDFLNEGQQTKYMIQSDAKEELIVNIHIQEGDAEVQITNLNKVNLNKKSDSKNKILHFVIKSQDADDNKDSVGLINPMGMSNQIVLYHVTIKSLDTTKAVSYTISYSSGKRETYLQDGLILDYILEPNKASTFYYFNEVISNHIFYTLSMDNSADLEQLKIKTYYLEDPNDLTTKKEVQFEKPAMNRKTPNPAILYSLPAQNFIMIELTNPSSKQKRVSMGINHQQVILLPFDHEFPFQLHKTEQLNILVDVNIPGFLDLSIRKCDRSEPKFAYSFDYDGFIREEFMYNSKLSQQPFFHYTIKANRIGTLYVNFQAEIDEGSIISMKVVHSEEKSKEVKMKAGKKGVLSYELSQNSAKVTIPAAICGEAECKGVKYYYLSSKEEEQVYSQLACSSSFFSTSGFTSSAPLPLTKIDGRAVNKTVTFDFPVHQSTYLGIKAVGESGEQIFYQPIEIASLWQKWVKVSMFDRILMVFIVCLCLCVCIVFVRRASRKGYKPLDESQE